MRYLPYNMPQVYDTRLFALSYNTMIEIGGFAVKPDQKPWGSYGSGTNMDDYLSFCQSRKQELYLDAIEGDSSQDADEYDRGYPSGYQLGRG